MLSLSNFSVQHRQIHEAQLELDNSQFYRDVRQLVNSADLLPESIVCFGIGRFSNCHIARYQLAFILNLQRDLNTGTALLHFHEPALSVNERNFLTQHFANCSVHPTNVEGKHCLKLQQAALIFLPHCPKQLTNNFLWANWNTETLRACTLLCNSFRELCVSQPQRFLNVDAAYIVRLQEYATEKSLPNTFRYRDIFNDTSVHTFANLPDDFCEPNAVQPVYAPNDSELICANVQLAFDCEEGLNQLVDRLNAAQLPQS